MRWKRQSIFAVLMAAAVLLLPACEDLPRDPNGTWLEVRGDTLHVGLSHNPPWVLTQEEPYAGIEVALLRGFAEKAGAEIDFTVDAEADLFAKLRKGQVHVIAAGLEKSTPYKTMAGLTVPYLKHEEDGKTRRRVLAVHKGENRFLMQLERFLLENKDRARRMYAEAAQ